MSDTKIFKLFVALGDATHYRYKRMTYLPDGMVKHQYIGFEYDRGNIRCVAEEPWISRHDYPEEDNEGYHLTKIEQYTEQQYAEKLLEEKMKKHLI